MAVGDEYGLTEDLYQELIGRYVATIEVLSKRVVAKDQYIARLETENAKLEARLVEKTKELHPGEVHYMEEVFDEYPDGEVLYVEKDSEAPVIKKVKGKK